MLELIRVICLQGAHLTIWCVGDKSSDYTKYGDHMSEATVNERCTQVDL